VSTTSWGQSWRMDILKPTRGFRYHCPKESAGESKNATTRCTLSIPKVRVLLDKKTQGQPEPRKVKEEMWTGGPPGRTIGSGIWTPSVLSRQKSETGQNRVVIIMGKEQSSEENGATHVVRRRNTTRPSACRLAVTQERGQAGLKKGTSWEGGTAL